MTATEAQYSALITSEHNDKPKFKSVVELLVSGSVDQQNTMLGAPSLFDLDTAVGTQLDQLGLWVGFTRFQNVPSLGLVELSDTDYRVLLRAKILANHWDGGMQTLQVIIAQLFPGSGVTVFAVDNQDMTMTIYLLGTLNSTQIALLKGGLLVPKPEGVHLNGVIQVTGPLFGLGEEDSFVSGLGVGSFFPFL